MEVHKKKAALVCKKQNHLKSHDNLHEFESSLFYETNLRISMNVIGTTLG